MIARGLAPPGLPRTKEGAGFVAAARIFGQALDLVDEWGGKATIPSGEGRDDLLFIAACLLIGVGVGMLFDRAAAGALIGLGAGLILENLWRQRTSGS